MTDENWSSESTEAPPKKKGFPKWLMFLGCGCLGMVGIAAVGGGLLYSSLEGVADPEVQWPAIAEVLPFDGEHPDLVIANIPFVNITPGINDMWVLTERGSANTATVYLLGGENGHEIADELLSSSGDVDLPFVGGVHDVVEVTVLVQGRELRAVRFTSFDADEVDEDELAEDDDDGFMSEMNKALKKAAIRIDVTQEGVDDVIVLIEYAKAGTLEPVTDEEINKFLAPFNIGPDR